MATRPKIDNIITARKWDTIRAEWLRHVPTFPVAGAAPEPGLDHLPGLAQRKLASGADRGTFEDVEGLRTNILAEAVFLFHKCAHAQLAAQRLGAVGMHSWAMFNAYHSAYLGARGIMALLGVAFTMQPNPGQVMIDIFKWPEDTSKTRKALRDGTYQFSEFFLVKFGATIDQSELWQAFGRTLRVSNVSCWKGQIYEELKQLSDEAISRPRNAYLYRAAFWPLGDLLADLTEADWLTLPGDALSTDERGFLLRLGHDVYRTFEDLITDLAKMSNAIENEIRESRVMKNPAVSELDCYNQFVTASIGAV